MGLFKKTACQFIGVGPVIPVPDIPEAVRYYCEQLGFEKDFIMGEPPSHGSITRGRVGVQFTLVRGEFRPTDYPGWFYFFVENADDLAREYGARGIGFSQTLGTRSHGMREFEIGDLNGYKLRFGQYI
ncbi:MAG: hypothetical protein AMXMBFR37_07280 [Steroidobacteraceae bacterium]